MRDIKVKVHPSKSNLKKKDQLAWKIAEIASDTTRIDKILPTLNFLIKEKAKIIILSHVGRPKGKIVKELSLEPIRVELEKKLSKKIKLISENIKEIKNKNFFNNYNEEILILENIRFYSEEEENKK